MTHVACPTCAHSFRTDDSQHDAIIVCPECNLSFRGQHNVVPESKLETEPAADGHPNQANESRDLQYVQLPPAVLIGGGGIVAVVLVIIIIFANFGSSPSTLPSDPPATEYTDDPVPASSDSLASPQRTGRVNYSLVRTLQDSWRKEGWRHKSKAEQAQGMALMIMIVQTDIDDHSDQQATLDYIQRTIDSW